MDAEIWTMPKRPDHEWDPFMRNLRGKMRAQRRWTGISRAAAAAGLFLALWSGLELGRAPESQPLRAEVPTTGTPVFQPAAGQDASQAPIILVCMGGR